MAPTGVAATNCGGVTMHSAGGLPISDRLHGLQHYLDISSHPKEKWITNTMKNVDAVILDEASMVSSNSLLMINRRLQELSGHDGTNSLFGNVKLFLCVGDLHQLAPVDEPWIFEHVDTARLQDMQMGSDPCLWQHFTFSEIEGSV